MNFDPDLNSLIARRGKYSFELGTIKHMDQELTFGFSPFNAPSFIIWEDNRSLGMNIGMKALIHVSFNNKEERLVFCKKFFNLIDNTPGPLDKSKFVKCLLECLDVISGLYKKILEQDVSKLI